ncbi:MAG: GNAT family N-acetyltransferase [Deltaproteobacteria bacterium]|nr:GNAT family N-acetyltransferase [Deltaproteobacteria bacterium]
MMKINLARLGELDVLHGIIRAATRKMDEQGISQWDEVYPSRSLLKDDIEKQQMYVLGAGKQKAGMMVLNEEQSPEYAAVDWKFSGRALVIHRLTIDPAFQRRGLASRLMDFAEEFAFTERYNCIRLDAFRRNPAAFGLYERRGYRKAGAVRFRKGEFFCYEKKV